MLPATLLFGLASALQVGVLWLLPAAWPQRHWRWFLACCLLTGALLRLYFLLHFPFTNDEGAYLYDAQSWLNGQLTAGDAVTKSPVAIALFAFGVALTNGSLYAARVVNLVISLATGALLAVWLKRIASPQAGLAAAALWLLSAGPATLTVFGVTEPVAAMFALASLVAAYAAWQSPADKRPAFLAGLFFAAALASRKTALAALVPHLYLFASLPTKHVKQQITCAAAGFFALLIPWLAVSAFFYGSVGITETLGIGYARITADRVTGSAIDLGGASIAVAVRQAYRAAAPVFLWLILAVCAVPLLKESKIRRPLLVALVWLLALAGLYVLWPGFIIDHLTDFLVPAALAAALAVTTWRQHVHRSLLALWAAVFFVVNTGSLAAASIVPWTGMFTATAVHQSAAALRAHVPLDEPILTAAVIVPYLSGHRVAFDITHPLWYRFPVISEQTRAAYLPTRQTVTEGIEQGTVRWILLEHLTDYAYLRDPDHLINRVLEQWERIALIPNNTGFRDNPISLWRQ